MDHSGRTGEELSLPLRLAWTHRVSHPPGPAFRGGTKLPTMTEAITYDYVFHTVIANGRLYFGSSTEEAVFCLDARTGKQEWVYYTEGAVRLAPTLWRGRVYVGSDDGNAYCLDGRTGRLVWKLTAAPERRRCIGNQRVVSAWPVRTGVAVADGMAYFASGLLPPQGVFLFAVDADTGKEVWRRRIPYSPNGQVLVDGEKLWLPTGRTCPAELRRPDGTPLVERPDLRRAQGASSVGKVDGMVVFGPCESGMLHIRVSDEPMPGLPRGYQRGVVSGSVARIGGRCLLASELLFLVRSDEIIAIDRQAFRSAARRSYTQFEGPAWRRRHLFGLAAAGQIFRKNASFHRELKDKSAWHVESEARLISAILAGGTLIGGSESEVMAFDSRSGKQTWSHTIEGKALGLAVADGSLFVSTDRGRIHCFRADAIEQPSRPAPSSRSPYPEHAFHAEAAEIAVEHADRRKGFCLVLGVGDGQLAYEIARRSEFFVVATGRDATRVRLARERLAAAGVYGKRVVVHHIADDELPYPDYFANLIVSDSEPVPSAALRTLQPYGGTVVLGGKQSQLDLSRWKQCRGESGHVWYVTRRGALDGAGEWTHLYANPANTVCSGDRLTGSDLRMQWFGPPGAEDVVDRHDIAMPPLFCDGKLFCTGLRHTLRAIDAYNGTRLWQIEIPGSVRKLMSHNAGFVCVNSDHAFVASGHTCCMIDTDTGRKVHELAVPEGPANWGYVAVEGDYLVGSTHRPAVREHVYKKLRFLADARKNLSRPVVSQQLFAYSHRPRELAWAYTGGVILDPTITVGDGTVYFAESRNPECLADTSGATNTTDFMAKLASVVALDLVTGRERWRKPLAPNTNEAQWLMFLSLADGILLSTRTYWLNSHLTYELSAMDAATGKTLWTDLVTSPHKGPYAPLFNGKNAAAAHPCIVNGKIYWLAHSFGTIFCHDLRTGEPDHNPQFGKRWQNKGCAVPTASASALYYRDTSCHSYDLAAREKLDLTKVTRPGCWMSIVPAGGLVLMPEASSGCTCGFALQMSVVLAPR